VERHLLTRILIREAHGGARLAPGIQGGVEPLNTRAADR
jgi:hypothetical protein